MAEAKTESEKRNEKFERTPDFQRFKSVMGKLIKVPKKELDEMLTEYDRNSTRKRTTRKQNQPG